MGQQVSNVDTLAYVSTDGTIARYVVKLRGTDAFYALVDESDPTLQIVVSTLDGSKIVPTAGHAQMVTEYTKDVDGVPNTAFSHVDGKSVRSYVMTRKGILTARLYIPGFEG